MKNKIRYDSPKLVLTIDPITKKMRKYAVGDIYQTEWIQPDTKQKKITSYKILSIEPYSKSWIEDEEQWFSFFYSKAKESIYYRGRGEGASALKVRGRGYSE